MTRRAWRSAALALLAAASGSLGGPTASATADVGNDNLRTPASLGFTAAGTVENTNVGYGTEAGELTDVCGNTSDFVSRTAWWVITGTGQPISLSTAGSNFNTVLAVYETPVGSVPTLSERRACNNDAAAGVPTSATTFASKRGVSYLVQVGGFYFANGKLRLTASAPRPANDDRAGAIELPGGLPVTVDTTGATQESGEVLNCGGSPYAATIWFRWTAPAIGDATFRASAAVGNVALAVYPAAGGAPLGCGTGSLTTIGLRVGPGTYLVQAAMAGVYDVALPVGPLTLRIDFAVDPDVDGDGALRSVDCNDADASIRPGIVDKPDDGIDQDCSGADAVNLDRDGDGEARPGDCDDANPAINHGARDVPGNAVDEDCSGSAAPFPRIESVVRAAWLLRPFRLTQLQVLRAVPSTVEVRCSGRGCPFKKRVVKVKKAAGERSVLDGALKRARLRSGAQLEVRILLDGHVGFSRKITVGPSGKQPKILDRCLPVGGGKPVKC